MDWFLYGNSPRHERVKYVKSNSYYFDCSQNDGLYQIHIYLYQVPKGKQYDTNISHGK